MSNPDEHPSRLPELTTAETAMAVQLMRRAKAGERFLLEKDVGGSEPVARPLGDTMRPAQSHGTHAPACA